MVRMRWLRHRKTRRAAPFTAVRVGEASQRGPLSTKHLTCPHCPTWLSHSGTLRKHIQRFHTSRLSPHRVLCEWNFSEADAAEEGRRSRHSNVGGFISRVAELSARLRLMKSKPVLCLTETWADKGLPTMRKEGRKLISRHDRADGDQ